MKNILFSFLLFVLTSASLTAAPQAVVFDFGGVMTGEPNREAIIHFLANSLQLSEIELKETLQLSKNEKHSIDFWFDYARQKGMQLPENWGQTFKSVIKDAIQINHTMYALVETLKEKHIQVALLSNVELNRSKMIREFGLYNPFTPCILSCEINLKKPDPQAYQILLNQLQLPAHEIVFIDNKEENIDAAKKLGIDAILFQSADQIREELHKRELL